VPVYHCVSPQDASIVGCWYIRISRTPFVLFLFFCAGPVTLSFAPPRLFLVGSPPRFFRKFPSVSKALPSRWITCFSERGRRATFPFPDRYKSIGACGLCLPTRGVRTALIYLLEVPRGRSISLDSILKPGRITAPQLPRFVNRLGS